MASARTRDHVIVDAEKSGTEVQLYYKGTKAMASNAMADSEWTIDLSKVKIPRADFTVFKVPEHLLATSPEDFKVRMLQLGLQNRTAPSGDSSQTVLFHNLKLEIAAALHNRLCIQERRPGYFLEFDYPSPAPPGSWNEFARLVVGETPAPQSVWNEFSKSAGENVTVGSYSDDSNTMEHSHSKTPWMDAARGHFEKPTEMPPMSADAIQDHLALDALFIVFYFQYLNARNFNIREFNTLANDRRAVLRSLDMSDFLLLENQVPMYLLKNAVRALCTIDDALAGDRHLDIRTELYCSRKMGVAYFVHNELYRDRDPFDLFVEQELNSILVQAVVALLPVSAPTVIHPIPNPQASRLDNLASAFRWKGDSLDADEMLQKYLGIYYPPHLDAALEKSKHLLDCVYRVVSGDKEPPEEFSVVRGDKLGPPEEVRVVRGDELGSPEEYEWDESLLDNPPLVSIPSATQLEDLGIKVKCSTQCTTDSVELTHGPRTWFFSARLRLPNVNIYDDTGRVLRNLAVYEQLLSQDMRKYRGDLRCFLLCMLQLCREKADLELLSRSGVITVLVKSEEALSMWGRILEGVEAPVPSELWSKCYRNVHRHRRSRWKSWRQHVAMFWKNPWKHCAIILLLVMVAFLTWFTVVNAPSSKAKWPSKN